MKQNKYPPRLYRIFNAQNERNEGMGEFALPKKKQKEKKAKSLGLFCIVLYQTKWRRQRERGRGSLGFRV
jgi:hypothetical protein